MKTKGRDLIKAINEEKNMLKQMLKNPTLLRQECYIHGEWVKADSGRTVEVLNPSTGQTIGTIPLCGTQETRRAITAADGARAAWRAKTAGERSKVVRRWHDLLMENQEDLAVIMTAEQGKPLAEARGEIAYAASFFEWFAEEGKRHRVRSGRLSIHPGYGKNLAGG